MKLKLLCLAVLSTLSIGSARAELYSTTAPGVDHDVDGEFATFRVKPGASYNKKYYFKLASFTDLATAANINPLNGALAVNMDKVELFMSSPIFPSLAVNEGSYFFGSTSVPHTFHDLEAGNYYFKLSGHNYSAYTNQIVFQSSLQAPVIIPDSVPEPQTYALLLAGMGAVGLVARRRQTRQSMN